MPEERDSASSEQKTKTVKAKKVGKAMGGLEWSRRGI